jgi:hypothetical protein
LDTKAERDPRAASPKISVATPRSDLATGAIIKRICEKLAQQVHEHNQDGPMAVGSVVDDDLRKSGSCADSLYTLIWLCLCIAGPIVSQFGYIRRLLETFKKALETSPTASSHSSSTDLPIDSRPCLPRWSVLALLTTLQEQPDGALSHDRRRQLRKAVDVFALHLEEGWVGHKDDPLVVARTLGLLDQAFKSVDKPSAQARWQDATDRLSARIKADGFEWNVRGLGGQEEKRIFEETLASLPEETRNLPIWQTVSEQAWNTADPSKDAEQTHTAASDEVTPFSSDAVK